MDYNKLFVFYKAAKKKQFSNTGLSLSPSVVSRHVADLESELCCVLFHRTPKGLVLTAKGKILFEKAQAIFPDLIQTQSLLSSNEEIGNESLTIISPTTWASNILVVFISEFLKDNPNTHLNVISDDQSPTFSIDDAQLNKVAILPYLPKQENLIRRFLLSTQLKLYAHNDYIKNHGLPKSIEDLSNHRLIASSQRDKNFADVNWHLKLGRPSDEPHEPYLSLNDVYCAANEGLGIASLADKNYFIRSGNLTQILPKVSGPSLSVYYVYPQYAKQSRIVRKFGDFLVNIIDKSKALTQI